MFIFNNIQLQCYMYRYVFELRYNIIIHIMLRISEWNKLNKVFSHFPHLSSLFTMGHARTLAFFTTHTHTPHKNQLICTGATSEGLSQLLPSAGVLNISGLNDYGEYLVMWSCGLRPIWEDYYWVLLVVFVPAFLLFKWFNFGFNILVTRWINILSWHCKICKILLVHLMFMQHFYLLHLLNPILTHLHRY